MMQLIKKRDLIAHIEREWRTYDDNYTVGDVLKDIEDFDYVEIEEDDLR